jgi:hypothetical protein
MTLPQIIVDLLTLLFDMAVPAAICTMVLVGIALRQLRRRRLLHYPARSAALRAASDPTCRHT